MFDVALISRALAGPGQAATEAALDSIVQLAQAGDHARAAERAADLLADGYTDIRIVVPFALGVFEERGPESLPDVCGAIADGLSLRWAAIRPEARRERVVDAALSLLFRTIKALVDFHEATRGPAWQAWAARITAALPAACQVAVSALRAAIDARLDQPRCAGELAGVGSRAAQYFNRLPPPPAPVVEPQPEPAPPPVEPHEPPAPAAPPSPAPTARAIEVSPALEVFIRKLEAFEQLVQRQDLGKAAIVAQDIRAIVDHFDPRIYLPKLLAPHFRLLSAHTADLAPHWDVTPATEALAQLYQVDLDAFLEP